MAEDFPKTTHAPQPGQVVQVVMTEYMARLFETRCLGRHTKGWTQLSPPMFFGDDDVPTYIISVGRQHPEEN